MLHYIPELSALDEPSDAAGPRCAYMNSDSGTWATDDCNSKRPFVCKIYLQDQLAPKCPAATTCPSPSSTKAVATKPSGAHIPLAALIVVPLVLALLVAAGYVIYRYCCTKRRRAGHRRRWVKIFSCKLFMAVMQYCRRPASYCPLSGFNSRVKSATIKYRWFWFFLNF